MKIASSNAAQLSKNNQHEQLDHPCGGGVGVAELGTSGPDSELEEANRGSVF